MSSAGRCPRCGRELLRKLHGSAHGRFRVCAREACEGVVVPESPEEWRATVQADLDSADAHAARLADHLDRCDELIRGLPEGSIRNGRRVDPRHVLGLLGGAL